ncbi:MAG: hypothetical protein KC731_03040, partial [Myxococcales bacterium]|nr:hypothetical protein [Myxococcales bacterium]
MDLETFKKLPLGGVDRRALIGLLQDQGAAAAERVLATQRARMKPHGVKIAEDAVVLFLGGSNGITRSLAAQLA